MVIFRDTQTHFMIICIWSNHTKCKFLISALSNDWTSGHPAPPPSPPRPPRLSSPPGLLLRALPRSILYRSCPEETCASTPFGLDLKVHHRGTKTQNFPLACQLRVVLVLSWKNLTQASPGKFLRVESCYIEIYLAITLQSVVQMAGFFGCMPKIKIYDYLIF